MHSIEELLRRYHADGEFVLVVLWEGDNAEDREFVAYAFRERAEQDGFAWAVRNWGKKAAAPPQHDDDHDDDEGAAAVVAWHNGYARAVRHHRFRWNKFPSLMPRRQRRRLIRLNSDVATQRAVFE